MALTRRADSLLITLFLFLVWLASVQPGQAQTMSWLRQFGPTGTDATAAAIDSGLFSSSVASILARSRRSDSAKTSVWRG